MKNSSLLAYCLPFVVFLVFLTLVHLLEQAGFSNSQYLVFPLQTLVCGGLLAAGWRHYRFSMPSGVGLALATGVLVFAVWVAPQAVLGRAPRLEGFDPGVFALGSPLYWGTVGMRFLRLVVIVPLLEEIFWRGFLLRYFIREDFESVAFGAFSWLSFGLVTVFFMLEHDVSDYPAALVAGVLYNGLALRTRSLSSCVLAHAVTNLLLGFYIMATRQWGFW